MYLQQLWFVCLLCCLISIHAETTNPHLRESMADVVEYLYKSYDRNVRPPNGGATDVRVDVYIISLSGISEKTMDFTVNMYIRQRWKDRRLAHPRFREHSGGVLINYRIPNTWTPDLFIKNDKISKKSEVTSLNSFLRVNEEGDLTYSMRVTSTIACAMQLRRYPFDIQHCEILFESYGHTTHELRFVWNTGLAVEINEKIELPEHVIQSTLTTNCTKTYNATGSFSCINVKFIFRRNTNYYIMGLFLPSILIVVLSWVAFWIDKASTPGRVSLSLLTILTMQNQMSSTLSQLPKVSYIKLVDVWLTGCLGFVFAGFLEYALVNKLATQERELKQKSTIAQLDLMKCAMGMKVMAMGSQSSDPASQEETDNIEMDMMNNGNDKKLCDDEIAERPLNGSPNPVFRLKQQVKKMGMADKVDFYSRLLFPATFVLFNAVLWMCYLIPSDNVQ